MRVSRQDLQAIAEEGVIGGDQVDGLWRALERRSAGRQRFDLPHVAYYTGALLVIGAMGWFMGEAWERLGGAGIFAVSAAYAAAFAIIGARLWDRPGLRVPAGLLVTMAVCMTPLATYGLQRWLGAWGFDDPGAYKDFHTWIRGGWFTMEVVTIATGLLALRFFRFPFLTAPVAFALWYMSMDLTPIVSGTGHFDWELRKLVSAWFGLAMLIGAFVVDHKSERDFAFWGYLFGLIAFWGGLSLMDSDSELSKFLYLLINVGLMGLSLFLRRKAFIVFGGLGVMGYVGHLANRVFEDSLLFPFALTVVGIGIIVIGVKLRRAGPRIEAALVNSLPEWALRLRPDTADGGGK